MSPTPRQHRQPQIIRPCGWWACLVVLVASVAIASGADLAKLSLSKGSLTPAFDNTIPSYTAQLPYETAYTDLLFRPLSETDRVKVNGAASSSLGYHLPLKVGANVASVVITAANGKGAKTYRIVVTRAGLPRISVAREAGKPLELQSYPLAWGANFYNSSVLPGGLGNVVAFASGDQHTVALRSNGTMVAWGDEQYAQPEVAKRLRGIKAITAGDAWNVGLKQDGTLVLWGTENFGIRAGIRGLTGVQAISARTACLMVLKTNGTVVVRGTNQFGQRDIPSGLSGVKAIAAGPYHCVALKNDGTVVTWGDRHDEGEPMPAGLTGVRQIAAGLNRTLALKEDGTVAIWGTLPSDQPPVPKGLQDVKSIGEGLGYNVALKNDGSVVVWGRDRYGETLLPEDMPRVDSIWPGSYNCFALTSNTTLQDLGSAVFGTVGTPVSFTIKNSGAGELVLGKLTAAGVNADQFVISQPADSTIPPGGSTTFTVAYAPAGSGGSHSAILHIPSNDDAHSVFDLLVAGTGTCPQITVINPEVSTGITGQPFSQTFTVRGATGPVVISSMYPLPLGLSLSPQGVLSGTVERGATFHGGSVNIAVRATDSNGCTGWNGGYRLDIADYLFAEDTPSEVIPFTAYPLPDTITVTSNNQRVVRDASIVIEGSGENRTLHFTPEPNQTGFVLITVVMTSGDYTAKRYFSFAITAVNDAPVSRAPQIGRTVTTSPAFVSTAGHFTDIEYDLLTYSVAANRPESLGAGWGMDARTGLLYLTTPPSGSTDGEVLLTVTVTDIHGATASAVVKFDVGRLELPVVTTATTPPILNRRSGLYEWLLNVRNPNKAPITGYDVLISGLPASWSVWNPTTNKAAPRNASGQWVVHHGVPVPGDSNLTQVVTFYTPSRTAVAIHPVLTTLIVPTSPAPGAGSFSLPFYVYEPQPGGTYLSFDSTPGQRYQVYYSVNGGWIAGPALVYSSSTYSYWLDRTAPATGPPRQYFVELLSP